MRIIIDFLRWLCRASCIVVLVMAGTTLLVRYAPGYLSDAREMDARYSSVAEDELAVVAHNSRSPIAMLLREYSSWLKGDIGVSREYGVPVRELIGPRLAVTGALLLKALMLSWAGAIVGALLSSTCRKRSIFWRVVSTLLLVIPTSVMATVCLIAGDGGPVLVLALCIGARDFKFLDAMLRSAWLEPYVLYARSQGIPSSRILRAYIVPTTGVKLAALASVSIVTALSALVPVEVIFNVPGVGQLAWNAAVNRDLPVLLAATMIMSLAVTLTGAAKVQANGWRNA